MFNKHVSKHLYRNMIDRTKMDFKQQATSSMQQAANFMCTDVKMVI